jgi:NADH:ubiquinone oxidoreductase subunit 2 (subunit N)
LVLFTLIFSHIQLLVGIALWVMAWMNKDATVNVMKDSVARKNFIEHPITMILAVVFITIGYSKAKRATNGRKRAKLIAIFFGLGVLCMLSMNHWDKMAFLK